MRTDRSVKNGIVAILSNFVTVIISFLAQAVFVHTLGNEYNGLNGLFLNVISMLGVIELGFGSALIYHLYKPIAEEDIPLIKSLMRFYRNGYRIIAATILLLSLLATPFLHLFVSIDLDVNIYVVFLLFAIESSASYLLSYKRSILYADQKNYIINIVKIGYVVVLNTFQILVLSFTQNFYLYLIVKIIARILENIAITIIANKKYSYIRDNNIKKLDNIIKKDIFKKIRGLVNHRIGGYIVLGTDNIIISKFLDLGTVGFYTNYTLIINGIMNLVSQIFYSITAGVGNLLVEDNRQKSYKVYKNMSYINFIIACIGSIGFYYVSKPFISVWLGDDYILNDITVFILMIKLYLDIFGYTLGAFKTAGGIFYEDRLIPIFQALVNIVVSVGLVVLIGLPGVILGTIASSLLLYLYSYPIFVYRRMFKKRYSQYIVEVVSYFLIFIAIFFLILLLNSTIVLDNIIVDIVLKVLLSIFIPAAIILILFRKTEEHRYTQRLLKNIFGSIIKKNNKGDKSVQK